MRREQGTDLTGLSIAAITLALVAVAVSTGASRTRRQPAVSFGSLLSRYCSLWTAAAQADDVSKVAPLYAQDEGLVFIGLGGAEYRGWSAYSQAVQSALFQNAMSVSFAPGDVLHVARDGDVAWTTATLHVSIVWADGRPQNLDAEQTAVWEERDGQWLIVQEHLSSPGLQPEPEAAGS